ncbi:MAG: phosphate ABC transporter substrate-binding protein [Acidobacteria bacterium]|jgi:phosphate transport system substrate-binding protein|nr:phosphate ABC transporter substrate-binding protein [Acidobacteriota bacterium]
MKISRQTNIFIVFFVMLPVIFLLLAGCGRGQKQENTVQIKGSDTMVNLGQAWAEEYMKRFPAMSIAVTGGGSGTGIASLINNTCDIAEVSREMKEEEIQMARSKGFQPHEIKVALDGLAVVVNPANPVSQLTMDELAAIFTGTINNWKDIGGNDAKIVILSREVNSGTHVYFKEHVLRKGNAKGTEEFAPEALLLSSSQAISDEVAQNPSAIGYYGMGYITAQAKTLKIAKDKNSEYVDPTLQNIVNNLYPISRPLLMYTRGTPAGAVKEFLDFILSPDGQAIVEKLDFVPIKTF